MMTIMSDHPDLATYRSNPEQLYGPAFFKMATRSKAWQIAIGQALSERFKPRSAMDLGCGCGYYLAGLAEAGVKDITGVEFMLDHIRPHAPALVIDHLRHGDLNKPIDIRRTFDMVISLEVAEHLLPESGPTYVNNIVRHARDIVLFSASDNPAAGTGHINARPIEYWLDLMSGSGFVKSETLTEEVRNLYRIVGGRIRNQYLRHMSRSVLMLKRV